MPTAADYRATTRPPAPQVLIFLRDKSSGIFLLFAEYSRVLYLNTHVITSLQVPIFNGGSRAGVSSQRSKERISGVTGRALPWEEGSLSETVSSQRSKENICEGNIVQSLSSSSIGGSRTRSASSTPSKVPSKELSKSSFVTPSRPALQKARCFGGEVPLPNPAVLAARRSLDINSDGSPKISLRAVGDLAEQVQSLKKEKHSLESQKMELETNFQQVQSQLDAVLLFQEVNTYNFLTFIHEKSLLFSLFLFFRMYRLKLSLNKS